MGEEQIMIDSRYMVKLFTTNENYYMYDANRNRVLQLTRAMYNEINEHLRNTEYTSENIIALKRKDYLKESVVQNIEHPFTRFVENMLERHVSTLILQVTQNCNFRCRYCSFANNEDTTRTHSPQKMSFDIAKKSVDFLAEHCVDAKDVTIAFYGGEPLLNFSLIRETVEYAEKAIENKSIHYSMTSNMFLATDEIISFLAQHGFELLISLDGPAQIQNNHRRLLSDGSSTYDRVFSNVIRIKELHKEYFDTHVRFNPVVYPDENPTEILRFFNSFLGVDESMISLQQIDTTGINISFDPPSQDFGNPQKDLFGEKSESQFIRALRAKTEITQNFHINGSCVPGADKLFVNIDGVFFPCEKVNECNKNMQIGSLEKGFFTDQIKYLMNIGYIINEKCKCCWAIRFCKMCCAHFDDGESNLSKYMFDRKCSTTKTEALDYLKRAVRKQLLTIN